MSSLSEIKTFIQFLVIIFTLTINFIFILLVLTESPKKLGNYKYLMCYFSIVSMIFSFIDFLVQPYLHSHAASYGLYMDLRENFFEAYPTVAFLLAASLTGCFAATIYSIAINFVYRFFALERIFPTEHHLPDSTTTPTISLVPFSVLPEFELTSNTDNSY
ncbi:hypothetical protein CAEBREN_19986 [Caenorhabditis brenneri]|uniref:Uncharacterized protein n=1 Tax=Caenorhabditis brenneri TaxID=135651 RepID=G0P0P5_CAEBE|nr:hypothetical protein CAEBREN_19986 [Caenorhabditis brenneri]